jgi:hypothetical protein
VLVLVLVLALEWGWSGSQTLKATPQARKRLAFLGILIRICLLFQNSLGGYRRVFFNQLEKLDADHF